MLLFRQRVGSRGHCASPICSVNVWLSQNAHSSSTTSPLPCPMLPIVSLNGLPVGGIISHQPWA
jgi:hypothetical protein